MRNPAVTDSAETPTYSSPPSISPGSGTDTFRYIWPRYGVLSFAKRMSRLMREKFPPPRAATSKLASSLSSAGDNSSSSRRNGLQTVAWYRSRFASIQVFLLFLLRSAKNRKISLLKIGVTAAGMVPLVHPCAIQPTAFPNPVNSTILFRSFIHLHSKDCRCAATLCPLLCSPLSLSLPVFRSLSACKRTTTPPRQTAKRNRGKDRK